MTLAEGKYRGATRCEGGWELVIPAFLRDDGTEQGPQRVFWPDGAPWLPVR